MSVRIGRRRERGGATERDTVCPELGDARSEEGFSIVETMVAMVIIFSVLMALLGSLSTGIRGVLTGRQRTGATALAREVIEQARGADYDNLGHDLSGDGTLATDSALVGPAPNWTYLPAGLAAEPLVGVPSPTYPQHQWDVTRDGSVFSVRAYVTTVTVAVGDDHKRLTVVVSWSGAQYDPATVANEVRLSTLVSRSGVASGSEVDGVVDVDAGSISITGTITGVDLSSAEMFFPYSHSETAGHLVAETRGFAGSARSELELASGSGSGCSTSGVSTTCAGVQAGTATDNDGGTALPLQSVDGPTAYAGGTLSGGSPLSLVMGTGGSVTSKSSAESCVVCVPAVGDGDGLVYGEDVANGPGAMSSGFAAGAISGNLVNIASSGSATGTVDSDVASPSQRIHTSGRLTVPQVDLVTLSAGPVGFVSGVRIDSVDVTAQAQAGPASAAPTVTGSAIAVTMYDTSALGLPTYRTVNVTPGTAANHTAGVTFPLLGSTVTLDTTVASGSKSVNSQTVGGVVTSASSTLTNWFVITTRLRIVELGVTVADLTVELDYGRIAATAEYAG